MAKPFANPDQNPYFAASDLVLHCLLITLLGVSRLKWVNDNLAGVELHREAKQAK